MNFIKKLFAYNCISCGLATESKNNVLCEKCMYILQKEFTVGTTGDIFWCSPYKNQPAQDLVLYMKDNNDKSAFDLAAQIIHRRLLLENIQDIEEYYITFAPRKRLSRLKYKFDQSEKIGESLAQLIFSDENRCISTIQRSYFSKAQKSLRQEKRRKNLAKKLRISNIYKKKPLPKKLIIVDDVTTTGTTLEKTREILLRAGAENCIMIALCGVNFGQ